MSGLKRKAPTALTVEAGVTNVHRKVNMNSIAKDSNVFKLIPVDAIVVHQADIRTTSLKVAEAFGKQHKNVLQSIEKLDCSEEFASANFSAHVINQQVGTSRRDLKYYEMTKDGFIFLVGRFNGKLAATIFEAYINAFNVMAAQLAERQRPAETLTASEQQTLSEIAHKKAALHENVGKALAEIWSRLHNKFRIARYDQLARDQLADAIVYISQLQLKVKPAPQETINQEQLNEIVQLMRNTAHGWSLVNDQSFSTWVSNRIRVEFNIQDLRDIYSHDYDKVVALLKQMSDDAKAFHTMVHEGKQYFIREVIGAGQPYTAWVARRMGGKELLPNRPNWLALAQAVKEAS